MFARLVTRDCPSCDAGTVLCCTRIMLGEGRCCGRCDHALRVVTVAEHPDAEPPASRGVAVSLGEREESALVASLLRAADRQRDDVESFDSPSLSAYRSLAASRGVTLEAVVRHAVRDELRRIVELPPVPRKQPSKENHDHV